MRARGFVNRLSRFKSGRDTSFLLSRRSQRFILEAPGNAPFQERLQFQGPFATEPFEEAPSFDLELAKSPFRRFRHPYPEQAFTELESGQGHKPSLPRTGASYFCCGSAPWWRGK